MLQAASTMHEITHIRALNLEMLCGNTINFILLSDEYFRKITFFFESIPLVALNRVKTRLWYSYLTISFQMTYLLIGKHEVKQKERNEQGNRSRAKSRVIYKKIYFIMLLYCLLRFYQLQYQQSTSFF